MGETYLYEMEIEEMKEYQKQWYLKNKQLLSTKHKKYYIENKNTINDNAKKNYLDNKESIKKKHKEWRIANKEKYEKYNSERNKIYRQKHRAQLCERKRQKYNDNKNSHWEDQIKRKYGITSEQYFILLEKQGGVCAICEQPEKYKNKKLAVDHCHKTKKIRGLLCFRCNATIGQFKDEIKLFGNAISYLNKYIK